jgi:hypothetical protein
MPDDMFARGAPRRMERFYRRKPFFTFRLAGSDHDFIEGPAATKWAEFQSPIRQMSEKASKKSPFYLPSYKPLPSALASIIETSGTLNGNEGPF